MNPLEDDEEDSPVQKSLKRQARIECRQFARLFATPDGKAVLATIQRDVGWGGPGPAEGQKTQHWLGQRSVIYGMLEKISHGQRLATNPKYNDDE